MIRLDFITTRKEAVIDVLHVPLHHYFEAKNVRVNWGVKIKVGGTGMKLFPFVRKITGALWDPEEELSITIDDFTVDTSELKVAPIYPELKIWHVEIFLEEQKIVVR